MNNGTHFFREQIEKYGGSEGIRDVGGLDSAVNQACSGFGEEYFHPSLFLMAAAYLYHLVRNHPFVDGNKRIGLMSALVFLELNGLEVVVDPDVLADFILEVAKGMKSKDEITLFFQDYTKEL